MDDISMNNLIDNLITDTINSFLKSGAEMSHQEEYFRIKIFYPIEDTAIRHANKGLDYQLFLFNYIDKNLNYVMQQTESIVTL